ncbi:hypothetical protein HKD37_18G050253 [Glycine soja]
MMREAVSNQCFTSFLVGSKFGVVGQSEEWCLHAANYLNCTLLQFPFCYLGIPIGVNPKRKVVWDPIIRKFEDRMNRWKMGRADQILGLGSGVKWSAIRRMTLSNNIDILCIQETKKEVIDKKLCQYLWGDSTVTWECVPSSNAAGGLLCIWNNESFSVERRVVGRGFIMLQGVWVKENKKVFIINVYAPCDVNELLAYHNPKCYEMVSGLKINYAKSQFGCLGKSEDWCRQAAHLLNCNQLDFPFSYLGIPVGSNPKSWRHSNSLTNNLRWKVGNGAKIKFWKDKWREDDLTLQEKNPFKSNCGRQLMHMNLC